MGGMTEGEMRVHLAWLEMQWDRPSRADWYVMQNTAEVRRTISKRPNAVRADQFKITFRTPDARESKAALRRTPQERMMESKRAWLGAAGILHRVKLDQPNA